MKFFVFWEKWIYFQNKNILFRYKNLLNDLFHNIFWLQKVYHESKKRADPPYFRGIRAKIVSKGNLFYSVLGQSFHSLDTRIFIKNHETFPPETNSL